MNYSAARQRAVDGRWDYTTNGVPVGYCHEYKDFTEGPLHLYINPDVEDNYKKHQDKYHTDGHATKEEAENCYKQYILDHAFRKWNQSNSQRRCEICKEWTQGVVEVGFGCGHMFMLCDKHANREDVEKLLEIGESWHS